MKLHIAGGPSVLALRRQYAKKQMVWDG